MKTKYQIKIQERKSQTKKKPTEMNQVNVQSMISQREKWKNYL